MLFHYGLTYFSSSSVSRPLTSKWSAAPGRGESNTDVETHTHTQSVKHIITCSCETTCYDKHQHLQSHSHHFHLHLLVSSPVWPLSVVFLCYHTHTCTHVYLCLAICVFLYGINIVGFFYSYLTACVCDVQ